MPLLEQVLEKNPETVKIVFKNMPLTRIHKLAEPAARAALAAEEQGKFWEFHDELFAIDKLSEQAINNVAVKLDLDMEAFNKARTSLSVGQKISKDLNEAEKAGVSGTPTIFINGKKQRKLSFQSFQQAIDNELKSGEKQ